MHLAARITRGSSHDGPGEFIQTNLVGTLCCCWTARAYFQNLECKSKDRFRFHHISRTDEVYGDVAHPRRAGRGTYRCSPEDDL